MITDTVKNDIVKLHILFVSDMNNLRAETKTCTTLILFHFIYINVTNFQYLNPRTKPDSILMREPEFDAIQFYVKRLKD